MTELPLLLLALLDLLAIVEELISWIELVLLSHRWLVRSAAFAALMLLLSEQLPLVLQHRVHLSARLKVIEPHILMRLGTVPLPPCLLMMRLERVSHKLLELIVFLLGRLGDYLSSSADILALNPLERQGLPGVSGLRRLRLLLFYPLEAVGLEGQGTSPGRAIH